MLCKEPGRKEHQPCFPLRLLQLWPLREMLLLFPEFFTASRRVECRSSLLLEIADLLRYVTEVDVLPDHLGESLQRVARIPGLFVGQAQIILQ